MRDPRVNTADFSRRLNLAIEQKDWRPMDVVKAAAAAGFYLNPAKLGFWLRAHCTPARLEDLVPVARLLDVSTDWLLYGGAQDDEDEDEDEDRRRA